jgi:hypothetical protein
VIKIITACSLYAQFSAVSTLTSSTKRVNDIIWLPDFGKSVNVKKLKWSMHSMMSSEVSFFPEEMKVG